MLINLQMLSHPCIPGKKPHLMILCDLYTYCWIWFTGILLKIFASIMHQEYWFVAPVCVCVCARTILVWFWSQGNPGFITCIWKVFFLLIVLEEFENKY